MSSCVAHECDEYALDDEFAGGNEVRVIGVFRPEEGLAFFDEVALEGGFAVDQGGDDVALAGFALFENNRIAVADVGIDHGVAADLEGEGFCVAMDAEGGGVDADRAFALGCDVLGHAGCDVAVDGDIADFSAVELVGENDGASFAWQALDHALAFEGAQVAHGGRLAREPEVVLNFPSGGHQAAATLRHFQILKDVVLAAGKVGMHDFEQCSREQSMRCGADQGKFFNSMSIWKSAIARSCGLRCGHGPAMVPFLTAMKPIFFISIFNFLAAVVPVFAEEQTSADVKTPPAAVTNEEAVQKSDGENGQALPQELMSNQKEFLNLAEERRKDFIKHLNEANRLFQQKRIFETLEQLQKAEAIFKDSSEIYNLRASCYVEMRAFDKALVDFNNALKLSKDNPSIQFNIGEIYFVTHEWQKAVDVFEKVMKEISPSNIALTRLIEFKILLCKNKLGKKDEVLILAEKYDFLDDSPYYYYAKAALEYEAKNLIKAEEWLAIASRIFEDPNILAPWQDTLVEYGYIKSFYGGEESQEAE